MANYLKLKAESLMLLHDGLKESELATILNLNHVHYPD
jgi:hypothetical protein